jgi:uncharacterized protein with HEPN domain
MRRDRERLQDMLTAIADIGRYAVRGREAFEAEELIQVWMLHNWVLDLDQIFIYLNAQLIAES